MDTPLISMLVGNTAVACIIASVACAAAWFRRPALAHVAWVLVIVKLLTPPMWSVPVTVVAPVPPVRAERLSESVGEAKAQAAVERAAIPTVAAPIGARSIPVIPASAIEARSVYPSPIRSVFPVTLRGALIACWIAGSIALLAIALIRTSRFHRLISRVGSDSPVLQEEVERLATPMGLRRGPHVRVVAGSVCPMLWFLGGKPLLVLPQRLTASLTSEQRTGVIAHELAHLRRRDHWVRFLELVGTIVLWWHPLVWVARRGLREAEEQCCDAWVVALLPQARRRYADALVDALRFSAPLPLVAATGLGDLRTLKRRLAMILGSTPPKSLSMGGWTLTILLLAALPLAPVRGLGADAPRPRSGDAAQATSAPSAGPVKDAIADAVRALLATAQNPNENQQVRDAATGAVARFGVAAVPVLIDTLATAKPPTDVASTESREVMMNMLSQMNERAVDPMLTALKSPDAARRTVAVEALDRMMAQHPAVSYGSFGAAQGGGLFGGMPAAGPALPGATELAQRITDATVEATSDADPGVRRTAIGLLGRIASLRPDARIVPTLVKLLKDQDSAVRERAALALLPLGPMASDAIDALATAVTDSNAAVRVAAVTALGSLGAKAKSAMPAATALLKDNDPSVRAAAATALGNMLTDPPSQPRVVGEAVDVPDETLPLPTPMPPRGDAAR